MTDALGASEFEFIVLNETPATLAAKAYDDITTQAQENRCWSGLYPAADAGFIRDFDQCLQCGDIPLHHLCAELGPGCLEAALPVRPLCSPVPRPPSRVTASPDEAGSAEVS